jgi:hypothetical protein
MRGGAVCHIRVSTAADSLRIPHSALSRSLPGAVRIPVPNPVREPNRCNPELIKPETPRTALYLVLTHGRLTPQVVCLGQAHFQLPVRPPEFPSRPTGENSGTPCVGSMGRESCQTPRKAAFWIIPSASIERMALKAPELENKMG